MLSDIAVKKILQTPPWGLHYFCRKLITFCYYDISGSYYPLDVNHNSLKSLSKF